MKDKYVIKIKNKESFSLDKVLDEVKKRRDLRLKERKKKDDSK